jgi:hypothetical protein
LCKEIYAVFIIGLFTSAFGVLRIILFRNKILKSLQVDGVKAYEKMKTNEIKANWIFFLGVGITILSIVLDLILSCNLIL